MTGNDRRPVPAEESEVLVSKGKGPLGAWELYDSPSRRPLLDDKELGIRQRFAYETPNGWTESGETGPMLSPDERVRLSRSGSLEVTYLAFRCAAEVDGIELQIPGQTAERFQASATSNISGNRFVVVQLLPRASYGWEPY
ncbi:hypothetical protein SAMN05892883_2417 [Jatrophihabitans sp. GAS493]|uniref:hypothetical protein n=1 Tax=Jatrophihabitans sp. GAS493 TaxID=1907575 RepID=UPI000BC07AB5|nr:hypothetical protein [Jatrophihabitans sp. GAS493]SOD73125.1 hypothetical protein SAMN05892883_2417 [Jatrophihabitans sp. GAS493]